MFFLSSLLKKEKKGSTLLGTLHKFSNTEDILIIGNTYKYLSSNLKYEMTDSNRVYYFELLANQYLSSSKESIKDGSPGN